MSDKQFKVKMMFDHLSQRLLPKDEDSGAFYKLREIFPVSAPRFEKLREQGIIKTVPGTDQYFYAQVLLDLLWHGEISPAAVFDATATPTPAKKPDVLARQRIIDNADAALAKRLNGKH